MNENGLAFSGGAAPKQQAFFAAACGHGFKGIGAD